ncbi:D-alanyl-D-alanine carboxypeptidase family protein [Serpentinicella sp. ANB-PHB4]|uniref:D-alanyl-D-alanine carboxypeptidase family protein n=1 Tax=Serpentinicella sp. ANB-PHB4 TaxID=3074076 RepID=UPI00286626FC|nr:D-alanyl-D-alanine carboxypeptidase family protein [Serpentinicella sp. ANB-PHB4]MDR5658167.1 D-alanyl-D-alanine carboxypeptidase family protein [Serpentinicella sp. ANB-PHB4]
MKNKLKFKYIMSSLLIFSIMCININIAEAQLFDVDARAAILIDASTRTVLYEKNIHEALPPASITKIMTMLLAMEALEEEKISLDDQVVVSERASKMGGTQLYLEPGEIKTIEELMKGIAIRSSNDACVAIAEFISGSEELFVQKMNDRAKELGMENTTFKNTNGLPEEGHVTSAYDIALMSKELLKHETVMVWLNTWMDEVVVGTKKQSTQQLVNTNKLIRSYKGANGLKTGYTSEAKHCLSASATRGNNSFIAVVLGAPTSPIRFSESAKLLDYGFANYNTIEIAKKGESLGNVTVDKGKNSSISSTVEDDIYMLVKKGEEQSMEKEIVLKDNIYAPIKKGDKIGEIIITMDGKEVKKANIVSNESVERSSIFTIMGRMFRGMTGH